MTSHSYPILEYDDSREAVLEPGRLIRPRDVPDRAVLCVFAEVINGLQTAGRLRVAAEFQSEIGMHPFYEMDVNGRRVGVVHPGMGGPLAAGLMEEAIAVTCRKFIACGGAGVLDRSIAVGHVVVPVSAVRDEGTSYHYLPPAREVCPSPEGVAAIVKALEAGGVPYVRGKTWTTDAIYRETPDKVRRRREEGCLTVEMEAASYFAVAAYRGVTCAQMLYGGDDVSGDTWDGRDWQKRRPAREALFWLAVEACLAQP